jgi:FeS assembly SUF system regulator
VQVARRRALPFDRFKGLKSDRIGSNCLQGTAGAARVIRLSKLADYGIVIMTHLARHEARQLATPEIATATGVPIAMASKILKLLVRGELLGSHRGAHGGYGLARPAVAITVADVIEALDGPIAVTSCTEPGPSDCVIEAVCAARTNWRRINGAIREALDGITIDEMARTIPEAFMIETAPARPRDRLSSLAG